MKKFILFLLVLPSVLVQAQTVLTCADARTYALSVSANNEKYNNGETFIVRGYVTSIQTAWDSQYKNASFWMSDTPTGGKTIQAYRCEANAAADVPNVGALVEVTGQLTKFNSTPEIAAGCTCNIITTADAPKNLGNKTIAEFLTLKNMKDTCILTGIVDNIVMDGTDDTQYNVYGNFDLLEIGNPEVKIYIYGLLTADKQSKLFRTMGIDAGDTLKLKAVYSEYNGNPQAASSIYISHSKYVEPLPEIDYTQTTVDFETAFSQGWDGWIGKTLTFTNDFYYCDTYTNMIAPRRLRAPEEYGEEGTAAYDKAKAKNSNDSCHLNWPTISWSTYRLGTIIRGLQATVEAPNQLRATSYPTLINNEFPTERPDLGTATLVVCAANIENFFVDNVGSGSQYLGAKSQEQLDVQKTKIASALSFIDADIYALAEVEQGTNAVQTLVNLLNENAGATKYTYAISSSVSPYNGTMVCYIYNKNKVEPYGDYLRPYTNYAAMNWREAIQCFKEKATGEKFNLSMNHFFAKISKTDADRESNMTYLISKIPSAVAYDPDMLVMGDFNAYTKEEAVLKLIRQGYIDLLMNYDPEGYSHYFDSYVGYLDHAYCNASMRSQVTNAVSLHLNADTPKSKYGYASSNASMYRYSDHDPIIVGLRLGKGAPQGVENTTTEKEPIQKELRHGQLIIIRSGVEYTVTGQRVR